MNNLKENKLLIPFLLTMGIVFILITILIFNNKKSNVVSTSYESLQDSVTVLTKQIKEEKAITNYYLYVVDSLKMRSSIITIIYNEQKRIISVATVNQLDSILRKNANLSFKNTK